MKEIMVTYLLENEELNRLETITEEYNKRINKRGMKLSPEEQFEMIICCGSKYDIDNKFKFYEEMLGIREIAEAVSLKEKNSIHHKIIGSKQQTPIKKNIKKSNEKENCLL